MRHFIDKKLGGHVMTYDGVMDLVDSACRANDGKKNNITNNVHPSNSWTGRSFESWQQLKTKMSEPWVEGVKQCREFLDELSTMNLPQPQSRRRKARWHEEDGTIDCDRALAGEAEMYRLVTRQRVRGATNIALLCNLDACYSNSPDAIFLRGAAAIAAADLLEAADYSCEIWLWCKGNSVYKAPHSQQFTCARLKECGDPINMDSLVNGLSAWFLRTAVFGSFADIPGISNLRGLGSADSVLGEWKQHMDISDNCMQLLVPFCTNRGEALNNAIGLLKNVIDANE
jgi:hypothetical protein